MKLTQDYFDDKKRINSLVSKIYDAIPSDEYYHVIFAALSEVMNSLVWDWAKSENKERWTDDKPK